MGFKNSKEVSVTLFLYNPKNIYFRIMQWKFQVLRGRNVEEAFEYLLFQDGMCGESIVDFYPSSSFI